MEVTHVSAEADIATPAFFQLFADLIGMDTTSHRSNLSFLDYVETYLGQFNVRFERIGLTADNKANLFVTIGPPDVPGYIVSAHCDTVPVEGQSWSSSPYSLEAREARLYGRGTCDMKGFLAVCLFLVPQMLQAPLKRPIHIAISHDEETGCIGVRSLLKELARRKFSALGCIVGEPTSMQLVLAHKGKYAFLTTVTGRAAHSSLAPLHVNAVEYAARMIEHIRLAGVDLRANGKQDPLYDIGHSTLLTGMISGGIALNIVPDNCSFGWELRTIAADDPDQIAGKILTYAEQVLIPEMRQISQEAGIASELSISYPELETSPDAPIAKLAKEILASPSYGKVAFGTEAGLFSQVTGIPSIVIGPGSINQAHKPDEFIEITQLQQCARFISGLIEAATRL